MVHTLLFFFSGRVGAWPGNRSGVESYAGAVPQYPRPRVVDPTDREVLSRIVVASYRPKMQAGEFPRPRFVGTVPPVRHFRNRFCPALAVTGDRTCTRRNYSMSQPESPSSSRRWFIGAASAALCSAAASGAREQQGIVERLAAIRSRIGGRLGVHVLDTHTGQRFGLDDDQRFAMASTFKCLLAAAVLSKVDRAMLRLDQRLAFTEKDMTTYAPVTSKYLSQGSLTLRELCAAVVEVSDNPAANLLLRQINGPEGLTKFVRASGDGITRLDRTETALNSNVPGDLRDTTTPRAMVGSMERVLLGTVLSEPSRQMLIQWMINSSTGLQRIRAGLPTDWKAGDKTGTGANGAVNDVAIVWPPGRKPLLLAVYMSESMQTVEVLSAAHARVAAEVVRELAA